MAKKIKPVAAETKKVEDVKPMVEVTHGGIIEKVPMDNDGVITVTPIEPVIEEKKEEIPDVVFDEKPLAAETLEVVNETVQIIGVELSKEERLQKFLESREVGEIKLNDFLKSLYEIPKYGEPSIALTQASSKEIRNMLDKVHNGGEFQIVNAMHKKLATFHYPNAETMKTEYHNINSVPLYAVKVN